jgi:hypothetical protein
MRIDFTLIADGTSDRSLIPILRWLILQNVDGEIELRGEQADLKRFPVRPTTLIDRVKATMNFYNPNLLFIHRDAENQPLEQRIREIQEATQNLRLPVAKVIPVRMTEAWLLVDETAIRKAVGNINGRVRLSLPNPDRLEGLSDPKKVLHDLLSKATELPARRRFPISSAAGKVADFMDCRALRQLDSFKKTEADTRVALESLKGIKLSYP